MRLNVLPRLSLRTCLLAVPVLAGAMAVWTPYLRDYGIWQAEVAVRANNPTVAIQAMSSTAFLAQVSNDPAVAELPELRGVADPVAEIHRQTRLRTLPDTLIVQVEVRARSAAAATTIVNAVVAISAADGVATPAITVMGARRVRPTAVLIRLGVATGFGLFVAGLILWLIAQDCEAQAVHRPAAQRRLLKAVSTWQGPADHP